MGLIFPLYSTIFVNFKSNELAIYYTVGCIIAGLLVGVFSFLIGKRTIIKEIKKVAMSLERISEGDGDLTQTVVIKSEDELGEMAKYFNLAFEKIRTLVSKVKSQSLALRNAGFSLSSHMSETAASINEITASIQSIKHQVANQSASVTKTSATMEQNTQGIEKLNHLIEDQSAIVTESSATIDQMITSVGSVTQTVVHNTESIGRLTEASDAGKSVLENMSLSIREVAKESEGLLEISRIITDIASQTNMLAMNAAIQAAHAGDSGKGFAVVAEEIRRLAESTSTQTETIASVLEKIEKSITGITDSSEELLSTFTNIESEVKTVAQQETTIRKAMEDQTENGKQVSKAIATLNDMTKKVRMSSEDILVGSRQVSEEAESMNAITQETTNGMNEMASGAEQITVAVNTINDLSEKNKSNIEALLQETDKFKT